MTLMGTHTLSRGLLRGWAAVIGLVLSMTALTVAPARAAVSFVDVPPGTQFHTEIMWLAEQGISEGWSTPAGREFRPTTPINRDAMAAFLYRYAGEPAFNAPVPSPFIDIGPGDQFYKEVTWLHQRGITTGWLSEQGREFRPTTPINRDAMAAFLYRFEGEPAWREPTRSPFSDLRSGVQFYREMTWLASKGITTGWDQRTALPHYRPVTPINRDAMAAFLYRLEVTKTGPTIPPASNANADTPIVGAMPSTFDTSLRGGDYPEELMQNLQILQPCQTSLPYSTLGQRVASWGKTYWGEEAGSSELSMVFSSVGSAMAFMADARAHGYCEPIHEEAGGYVNYPTWHTTEYWRPSGPWDEALVVGQETRLADGQPDPDLPFGEQFLFARHGNKVTVVWSAAWYVPGIGDGAEEYFYQSNRARAQELLGSLG